MSTRELVEPLTCFIEEYTTIDHDKIRGKTMILSGDFNINLLKIFATLIDNIFSNSLGDIVFYGIIANTSISDDQIIFGSFDSLTNLKLPMNARTTNKFIDCDVLKIKIKNSIYCKLNIYSDDDPNTNYNILESTLVTAIKKHTQ